MAVVQAKKILLLFDLPHAPPKNPNEYFQYMKESDWQDEKDIYTALKNTKKYDVDLIGIHDSISPLVEKIHTNRPDVVFSMAESFRGERDLAPHIVSLLELLEIKYTGASPESLVLCRNKGLTKKILNYHNIPTPRFLIASEMKPTDLDNFIFPAIVKPLDLEASEGISGKSVVHNSSSCRARIEKLRIKFKTDVIIEEFIPGKDIYVGVIDGRESITLPPRELSFSKAKQPHLLFATYRAKWDEKYRKKWGIASKPAKDVSPELAGKISAMCKRVFKLFSLKGYARIDLRISPHGQIFFLEANPNPAINKKDEFAMSAKDAGINYSNLVERIVSLSLKS